MIRDYSLQSLITYNLSSYQTTTTTNKTTGKPEERVFSSGYTASPAELDRRAELQVFAATYC